ncbi:hypothetical protein BCR41DRAFT_356901 [Lobosporangium transversale]|uniref:Tail specific protease domain-containing protein n=1 Tax=Lobosporangium transversale TaxID=64571 RepID=A0A1Y2GIJ9_9FUNG|nr:hypothetical protein BCR41DRAFT_357203 [Lobosporangium transversale]XP_021879867.1 hypothetical protein BCR41DRAFT_356901 [Lobosporangium transversale]ORZ10924.1 hypothetical protein BCR41DRAFT_357203 [Lobosporangium transversale]ORZ11770.1 hypothetical protein BCR41DRAFT_356901 [Lobosporangium transversale]|eukprot:XP_021879441.1 hypothetical protein BCR41DRAFT_357203 [Lobosporangium transversale]
MPPPDLPPKEEEEKEQEPVEEDPCATLGELLEPNITFEHVKRCYEHVPYNATLADDPFTTPPVDMTKSLDLLSKRQFNSDFEFHKEVDLLVSSLNDAHANYMDCEVVTIDGKNAIDAIQDWADINSSISKDRGVRLNKALASYTFDTDKKDYILSTGSFSTRATLPEHEKVVYQIKCPTSPEFPEGQEHHMDVKWDIYRLITGMNSTKKKKKEGKVKSHNIDLQESIQAAIEPLNHQTIHPIQRIHKRQQPLPSPAVRLVYNGTSTAFYQLLKRPEIGVVVIPTHSVNLKTETSIMEQGFGLLYNAGVQNVILDLTANGGGYVTFAYDLVDWMFPLDNITSVYQSDLRTPMSSIMAIMIQLRTQTLSHDRISRQISFLQDRLIRRSRHRTSYSPLVLMNHNLGAFEMDGSCGSACGMSLNRLKNTHGVKSYAVGGRQGEELSLFSFPGASVYGLDSLLDDFENLGVDPPMKRMRLYPITARYHEVLWEIVANNHWKQDGQTGDDPSIEQH